MTRYYRMKRDVPLTNHSHFNRLGPVVCCPGCGKEMQLVYHHGEQMPTPVEAPEIVEEFTIRIPEDAPAVTRKSNPNDSAWAIAGVICIILFLLLVF